MLYLSQFVFLFEIKATNVLTEDAFLWDVFSTEFVAYQP